MKNSKIYVDSQSYSVLVTLGCVICECILCILAIWFDTRNVCMNRVIPTILFSGGAVFSSFLLAGYVVYLKDISQKN